MATIHDHISHVAHTEEAHGRSVAGLWPVCGRRYPPVTLSVTYLPQT